MNKLKKSFLLLASVVGMAMFAACSGEDGATGAKGEVGEAGIDGKNGKDGVGCTLSDTTSKSGLEGVVITCGEDVRVVWNGTDGKDGEDGKDGKDGEKGKTGAKGDQGEPGEDGADGEDGKDGTSCTIVDESLPFGGVKTYVKCGEKDSVLVSSKNVVDGIGICPETAPEGKSAVWSLMNADADYGCFKDERDKQVYRAVKLGAQIWMAENLNYAYTGVDFDNGLDTDNSTSWCYNGDKSNCDTYGRLYTWSAAMDSAAQFTENEGTKCGYGVSCTPNTPHRGICPEGWHVPTNAEYSTLYTTIGGTDYAGIYLKSTDKWYSNASTQGIDLYGFSVLPADSRRKGGYFLNQGDYAYLWSASELSSNIAYRQYFYYAYAYVNLDYNYKGYGYSLRCLKD